MCSYWFVLKAVPKHVAQCGVTVLHTAQPGALLETAGFVIIKQVARMSSVMSSVNWSGTVTRDGQTDSQTDTRCNCHVSQPYRPPNNLQIL